MLVSQSASRLGLFAALTIAAGPLASADVLANYTFTAGSSASTDTDPNSTASNAAWVGIAESGFSSSTGTAFARSSAVQSGLTTSTYFEISLSAAAGYELDLSSITFDLGAQNASATDTYEVRASLRSDADNDNFQSYILFDQNNSNTATYVRAAGVSGTGFSSWSADLSGASYQDLSNITFRFYPRDDQNDANSFYRYDNVVINGAAVSTVVPEPSSLALVFSGAALCGIGRRRKPLV